MKWYSNIAIGTNMQELKLLLNEVEYEAAMAEVVKFFELEPKAGSSDADRFQSLLKLIDAYESKNYPI
ncbi:transcriptional regulator [Polynucleobacter necessarius]|uniref:transcriptional regulator n=1 Tax=Polynucleobacter necessarius TaxID=576610 RepID=UPI000E096CFD|nr:transcriptional regulator [Polynucleobacter necessarius]